MAKCPFRKYTGLYGSAVIDVSANVTATGYSGSPSGDFDPTDGTWYWVTTTQYGGPGGATGNGVTNDTSAISAVFTAAAAAGKGAYFPSGTYYMTGTVSVPSGLSVQGAGNTNAVITRNSGNGSWIFDMGQKSNISMSNIGFYFGGDFNSGYYCIWSGSANNITFNSLRFQDVFFGIKTGNSNYGIGNGLTITDMTAVHCLRPLYLADITNVNMSNSNIDAVPRPETSSNQTHCVYMERNCTYCTFTNVTWTRGSGYCLHLYAESSGNNGSHHITFDNCTMDARDYGARSCYIDNEYSYIYFTDCLFAGQYENSSSAALIRCANPTNVYITGTEAHGLRYIYGGSAPGSVSGDFYGENVGVSVWDTSGLTHHYEDWDVVEW